MSLEAWAPLLALAAVQLGAVLYWGGRISARLEAVERGLDRLLEPPPPQHHRKAA